MIVVHQRYITFKQLNGKKYQFYCIYFLVEQEVLVKLLIKNIDK